MEERFAGLQMSFAEQPVLCCLGQLQRSIVSTETWDQEKKHYMLQLSHKRHLLFAEATKLNNLQFNWCNCLFLTTGHYSSLCRFANYQSVYVHWTELQHESDHKTTVLVNWTFLGHFVEAKICPSKNLEKTTKEKKIQNLQPVHVMIQDKQ